MGCSLGPLGLEGRSLEGSVSGTGGSLQAPGSHWEAVATLSGGLEAPQHSAHCPFLDLSLGFPIWELTVTNPRVREIL